MAIQSDLQQCVGKRVLGLLEDVDHAGIHGSHRCHLLVLDDGSAIEITVGLIGSAVGYLPPIVAGPLVQRRFGAMKATVENLHSLLTPLLSSMQSEAADAQTDR